ncbi:GTP-binding protein Di-Ras1 isoform X1 [Haemorhous mexicanus]|uniref:GTP-binding protein Di-Ras1 isoform X1 n=1 Tax=Haemorhous mexicanus TaxID=30427 RepID=UPI0028BE6117|nr:GTP-binding protein Di-Ras1 isoform X1 [Haemorhous mexicanus]
MTSPDRLLPCRAAPSARAGWEGGSLPSEPPRLPRQQLRCRWPRSAIWPRRAAGKNSQGGRTPRRPARATQGQRARLPAGAASQGGHAWSRGGDASLCPRSDRGAKMPEQSNDYRVVVFGAGGVGKSSLVLRFVKGTFRDTYIPTIEDTYRQVISCDKSVCTLQITDTTGSHQFPAMQRLSISKGHAFILVFSVTSKQSLEELKPIYQQIVQIKGSVESIPIMLVGNKCDETQREVESREGEAMAKEWKCAFMETSAKMNYNVKELFQELLNLEKRRNVSLTIDGKRSSKQKRTDKIKGKCSIM